MNKLFESYFTESAIIFTTYRKKCYASINAYKGNFVKFQKSNLLSKEEKEKMQKVIDAIEELRICFYKNRGKNEQEKTKKEIM